MWRSTRLVLSSEFLSLAPRARHLYSIMRANAAPAAIHTSCSSLAVFAYLVLTTLDRRKPVNHALSVTCTISHTVTHLFCFFRLLLSGGGRCLCFALTFISTQHVPINRHLSIVGAGCAGLYTTIQSFEQPIFSLQTRKKVHSHCGIRWWNHAICGHASQRSNSHLGSLGFC